MYDLVLMIQIKQIFIIFFRINYITLTMHLSMHHVNTRLNTTWYCWLQVEEARIVDIHCPSLFI